MAFLKQRDSGSYLNAYEAAYHQYGSTKGFDQTEWEQEAREGNLDRYINMLSKSNDFDWAGMSDRYNARYATPETRLAMKYNETYTDKSSASKKKRSVLKYNDDGTIMTDSKGVPVYEEQEMTDYEYYARTIKEANTQNMQKIMLEEKQAVKDARNWFLKAANDVGDVFITGAESGLNILDNILAWAQGGFNALFALDGTTANFKEYFTEFADRWVNETNAHSGDISLEKLIGPDAYEAVLEFEREHTDKYNVDGTPADSVYMNYVVPVVDTLSKAVVSRAISGGILGNIAGKVPGIERTPSFATFSKVLSTTTFYTYVTGQNITEMYRQFAADGISVPNGQILVNATLKSTLQAGAELVVDRVFGGATQLDNWMFGRKMSSVGSKIGNLKLSAASKILIDAIHEGTEEVLQDCTDWFVDRSFKLINDRLGNPEIADEFGNMTQISMSSLFNTFVVAALTSLVSSTFAVAGTHRVSTGKIMYNKDGSIKYDKDGDVKYKKLTKLESYALDAQLQSMGENLNKLTEYYTDIDQSQVGMEYQTLKQYDAAIAELGKRINEVSEQSKQFAADEKAKVAADANYKKQANPYKAELVSLKKELNQLIQQLSEFNDRRFKTTNDEAAFAGASLEQQLQALRTEYASLKREYENGLERHSADIESKKEEYKIAFKAAYSSFRLLAKVATEMGEEEFSKTQTIIKQLDKLSGKEIVKAGAELKKQISETLSFYYDKKGNLVKLSGVGDLEKVMKRIEDAGITEIERIVERGQNIDALDVNDTTKQALTEVLVQDEKTSKAIITKDGNKVIAIKTVDGKDVIFIPAQYAKNADGTIIYETLAEQELVENICAGKFKGLVLDTVLKTYREVSGVTQATLDEAVWNLIFNESFFTAMLSVSNTDMYHLLSSIKNIAEKTVAKDKREVAYVNKMKSIFKKMSELVYNYCILQPYADINIDILTKNQQRKIAAARWCNNLYGRVINDATFKQLTENDWNVLNARVNSLAVDASEKQNILNLLKSAHSQDRQNAMNRINQVQYAMFTSAYDGKIYMPDTNNANRAFNVWLQKNGLTIKMLTDIDTISNDVKQNVTTLYGEFTAETLYKYYNDDFIQSSNEAYSFAIVKGAPVIYENKTGKQVGFATYQANADLITSGDNLDTRSIVIKGQKDNGVVTKYVNPSIDMATQAYLSIDDIINDPSLLSSQVQSAIVAAYGELNSVNTFLYLRDDLIKTDKTRTLIILADGTYAFGEVKPMTSILKSDINTITNDTSIEDIVDKKYLTGRLKDVKFVIDNNVDTAQYIAANNTIFINSQLIKGDKNYLTFAILHEFQHAIQVENGMNLGIDSYWINSKTVPVKVRKAIVADVRKHYPQLFKNVIAGSNEELKIVNDYVYHASGEVEAYGIRNSSVLDFYPVRVEQQTRGTIITMPWGTQYNVSSGIPMSLVRSFDIFDLKLNDADKQYYQSLATDYAREITTNKGDKLLKLFKKDATVIYDTLRHVLSVVDDRRFINTLKTYINNFVGNDFVKLMKFSSIQELLNRRIQELIDIEQNGLLPKHRVTSYKTLTLDELNDWYKTYRTNMELDEIAATVFKKMQEITRAYNSDIQIVSWADDLEMEASKRLSKAPTFWAGLQLSNAIRYSTSAVVQGTRTQRAELLLHESIHYVLSPLIAKFENEQILLSKGQLQQSYLTAETNKGLKLLNELYTVAQTSTLQSVNSYRTSNLDEFSVSISDREYTDAMNKIQLDERFAQRIADYTGRYSTNMYNNLYCILQTLLDNITEQYVYTASDFVTVPSKEYQTVIETNQAAAQMSPLFKSFKDVHFDYDTQQFYTTLVDGTKVYDNNTHFDSKLNKYYIIGPYGQVIFEDDYRLREQSRLGIDTNQFPMSLAQRNTKRSKAIQADIKEMYDQKIDENTIFQEIQRKYPKIPTDVLTDIYMSTIQDLRETAKHEAEIAAQKERTDNALTEVAKDTTKVTDRKQKAQRSYQEGEKEMDVIKNTHVSETRKWIEKRPKLDANGKVIRNSSGQIVYTYVYPTKSRYVSQTEAKGTNLEKYGYTQKYKRTQMPEELKNFIVAASPRIAPELWNKVKSGKLTTQDVLDYLRDTAIKDFDDNTFQLINRTFFKNSKIKSVDDLDKFVTNTSQYYAMRAVIRAAGFGEALLNNASPDLLERLQRIIGNDPKLKKVYDGIVARYDTYKGTQELKISEKYLRYLWMKYYDGTLEMAGYIATIAKAISIAGYQLTSEVRANTSLEATINPSGGKNGDDKEMTLADVLEDKGALDAFDAILGITSREEKTSEILQVLLMRARQKHKNATYEQFAKYLQKARLQIEELSDKDFAKYYAKYVGNMTEEDFNAMYLKAFIAQSTGIDINELSDKKQSELEQIATSIAKKVTRNNVAIVNNIKSISRTIRANLTTRSKKLFLQENSDIFDDNGYVKKELYQTTDSKGRIRLKPDNELTALEDRIRQLSKNVQAGDYTSKQALYWRQKFDKQIAKLQAENERLAREMSKGKSTVINVTVADDVLTIDANKEVPDALKRILATSFKTYAKSKTQYLANDDEMHIKMNLESFIKDNAELLTILTQADVDAIIDFYTSSDIVLNTNKSRQYMATEIYLGTYLLQANKLGKFLLTEEQRVSLESLLERIVSTAGAELAAWKTAKRMLDPVKVMVQSLAKKAGIEFYQEDINDVSKALESGNVTRIQAAKEKMYRNAMADYKGRKKTFLDKLFEFERMAMLSGPGTWVRNQASNVLVSAGNLSGEQIGNWATNLISKLFPKSKMKKRDEVVVKTKQYKIIGTKVSEQTQQWIKTQIIDSKFIDLISDGLSKYNPARFTEVSTSDNMVMMIINAVRADIYQNQTIADNEVLTTMNKFIATMMSDNFWIKKAMIRYLGKILTEDNVDLSKGVQNKAVLEHIADAYVLAARDYMHKPNFMNDFEQLLREKLGPVGFFAYKQFMPFASASMNWLLEAMNYTPVGLAKAIIDFAKLEDTVNSLELARQRGEKVVSARFADYLVRRRIGKGVIGTIGMAIGAALAAFGLASIDDKDDKYKLRIGNVYVDISAVFGTQGILLGMALVGTCKGGNPWGMFATALGTMLEESTLSDLYNTFRYTNSFGDALADMFVFDKLNMFIPNFVKQIANIANIYKVKYSKGILGKFEYAAVSSIPFLAYAMPKRYDPYSGEAQVSYNAQFITNLANRLLPFKVYPYHVSELEKEAISVGVNKGELTGKYTVNDKTINLSTADISLLNEFYGKLNANDLEELFANKRKYKVKDNKTGKFVELVYSRMTDDQKKNVIERVMSTNADYAKIYVLTSTGKYKYYATEAEYTALKKLGITQNVYRAKESKYVVIK